MSSNKGMMSFEQFILNKVAEEANEIGQAALKAAQFGLAEVYPATGLSNARRLMDELNDLMGVLKIMDDTGIMAMEFDPAAADAKRKKILNYLCYSVGLGKVHHSALEYFAGE